MKNERGMGILDRLFLKAQFQNKEKGKALAFSVNDKSEKQERNVSFRFLLSL